MTLRFGIKALLVLTTLAAVGFYAVSMHNRAARLEAELIQARIDLEASRQEQRYLQDLLALMKKEKTLLLQQYHNLRDRRDPIRRREGEVPAEPNGR